MKLFINIVTDHEQWKDIVYKNIKPKYMISDHGRVKNIERNKILGFNNPGNEKGYCRVALEVDNKKYKKFSVQRLVLIHFNPLPNNIIEELEANHIDGNKLNNRVDNLEWVTANENKAHAAKNNLYENCDRHFKAFFTNDEVHQICKYFVLGYSLTKIINIFHWEDRPNILSMLSEIKHRKSWRAISDLYVWDNDKIYYKTYSKEDIIEMSNMLIQGIRIKDILPKFDYDSKKLKNMLKKLNQGKLYKGIYKECLTTYRSTTIL